MCATSILLAIDKYLQFKDDIGIKKDFAKLLNDYIDFRVKAIMNDSKISTITLLNVLSDAPSLDDKDFIDLYKKWFIKVRDILRN